MKKGDFWAIFAIIGLALGLFCAGIEQDGGELLAVVTREGRVIERVVISGLGQPIEITVEGEYENKIVFADGYATFESANCPNKTCVAFGKLKRAGQVAVCSENKVTLAIKGQNELDTVVK